MEYKKLIEELPKLIEELDRGYNGYGPDGYGFYYPDPKHIGPFVYISDVMEVLEDVLSRSQPES